MYENTNLEDLMYNTACRAIEKKVLKLIDEDKIKNIIDECFSEELAKKWIEDFISYDDNFRDKVIEVSMSIIEPKLIDMIKKMD